MTSMEDPLLSKQPCEVCNKPKQFLTCDKCGATVCNRDECRYVFDISPRFKTYYCVHCVNVELDKFEEYYSSDSDWEEEEEG